MRDRVKVYQNVSVVGDTVSVEQADELGQDVPRVFVPLKTAPFDAFVSGEKSVELRGGPRPPWGKQLPAEGRLVVLRKGYRRRGPGYELRGWVGRTWKEHGPKVVPAWVEEGLAVGLDEVAERGWVGFRELVAAVEVCNVVPAEELPGEGRCPECGEQALGPARASNVLVPGSAEELWGMCVLCELLVPPEESRLISRPGWSRETGFEDGV